MFERAVLKYSNRTGSEHMPTGWPRNTKCRRSMRVRLEARSESLGDCCVAWGMPCHIHNRREPLNLEV